jgi:hypothetical protein
LGTQKPADPSPAEEKFFKRKEEWIQKEGACALIQSTKPQSLAAGLSDSPAGLAAWIVEKYRAWSDCGGNIESRFTKDEILTHIMIYCATNSIGTSFLPYYDYSHASPLTWAKEGIKNWSVHPRSRQRSLCFQKISAIRRGNGRSDSSMYNVGRRCRRATFRCDGRAGLASPGHSRLVPYISPVASCALAKEREMAKLNEAV